MLGAGTMGHGIAHAAMAAGYDTALFDVSEAALGQGPRRIDAVIAKRVELGKITRGRCDAMRARLRTTNVVAEAVARRRRRHRGRAEQIDLKLRCSRVEAHAPARAVFASNTSALSITEMAAVADAIPRGSAACTSSIPCTR